MRKLKWGFAHLFIVFAIAIIGIGALGYFAYKNGQIKTDLNKNDTSPAYTTEKSGSITSSEPRIYYNEHTRAITSPELERPDGSRFKYSLYLPTGWTIKKLFDEPQNPINLVIVKDNHILDINSVWLSSECIFFGEKLPESQYERFVQYKNLNTKFGPARVGRNDISLYSEEGYVIFRFCQLETNSNDPSLKQWMSATKIGIIEYRVPLKYDEKIIQEMDSIVSSISYTEI